MTCRLTTLFTGLSLALLSVAAEVRRAGNLNYSATCSEIATSVSSASKVYYPGSTQYKDDNYHWDAASSQESTCSFEPANALDVGIALQIIAKDQTPFAVKSGGRTVQPGSSSTPGVQIAMDLFSDVVYHPDSQTATIGLGLTWDDVYEELADYNVTAVGAKYTDVGVGGMVLGGGYSYLTSQYGLTVDNVVALELVLPNGTVIDVTNDLQPDLFYGLRGGFNNFGIVTTVTVKTYPQGEVWGGLIIYPETSWDAVILAVANFTANVTTEKATVDCIGNYLEGVVLVMVIVFYDGPEYPDGIFDELLAIEYNVKYVKTQNYLDLVQSYPANLVAGLRAYLHWVVLEQATVSILEMIKNQTLAYAAKSSSLSGVAIVIALRPFLPSLYDNGAIPSAFPSNREGQGYSFIEAYFGWTDSSDDEAILELGDESAAYMKQFILDAGQDVEDALLYPNCAAPDTPLESMYGDALDRLHSIRSAADPHNVMNLTGGWRF